MLDTPHRGWASSPIFQRELRRLGRFRTALQLKWYTLLMLGAPSLIFLNVYLLLAVTSVVAYNGYVNYGQYYLYNGSGSSITSINFLISLASNFLAIAIPLAMLVTDFNALSAGFNSINQQRESGQWEMLRLTPDAIIGAKLATVQIRAWRTLALELGLRLLPIVVLLTLLVFNPDLIFTNQSLVSSELALFQAFSNDPLLGLLLIIILLLTAYGWMSEPIWRMRAWTALSMSISGRTTSTMMASIYGFFTWIGLRILQVFSLGGVAILFVFLYTPLVTYASFGPSAVTLDARENVMLFVSIVGYAVWIYLVNRFYAAVRTSSVHNTIKRAFADLS